MTLAGHSLGACKAYWAATLLGKDNLHAAILLDPTLMIMPLNPQTDMPLYSINTDVMLKGAS
jgi:hypothetical protein